MNMLPRTVKMTFLNSHFRGYLLVLWESNDGSKEFRNVPLELEAKLRKNYHRISFSDERTEDGSEPHRR
jgi:hypothetical protein